MSRDAVAGQDPGPGFYGKLPARGDFVGRRLRRDFRDPWDSWLQAALACSRERLGGRWLECYLTSPLWRFALSRGICGRDAVAGLLMPSVDRVGRYYPLLIAVVLKDPAHPLDLVDNGEGWFRQAEQVALMGLDDGLDLEDFDRRVQALGMPRREPPGEAFRPDSGEPAGYCPLDDWEAFLERGDELRRTRCSLWWSRGSGRIEPCLLGCRTLPPVAGFAALLAGEWRRWGWGEKPLAVLTAGR